jgi:3-hydroxy acid dehydrogenase / malonic semialdehyde reductase
MGRIAFITGATSGFGRACAERFAAEGWNLLLNGRRKERLEEVRSTLTKEHPGILIHVLPFDVQEQDDVFAAIRKLPDAWRKIDLLINNAGLALGRDFFDDADIEDWNIMIDTNVKGLLYVSKAVIPFMIENKKGHIINIGSTAAKEVYEKGNIYCASKHAVDAISQAMRIDLLRHGIKVTAIHPGAAETEFSLVRFKGDQELADKVYDGFTPLYGADVAEVIHYCTTLPDHVCINDLVLTATRQANSFYFHKQ